MRKAILFIVIIFLLLNVSLLAKSNRVLNLKIDGIIGPTVQNYLLNNIEEAESRQNIDFILLEINTPGGLSQSMRTISNEIMNFSLPVVGYVTPAGAHAASAGAFIMMACDVCAMAPTSSIGAAHPVNMGGKMDSTMQKKVVNDMVTYITGMAKKHKRNEKVAEKMVKQSISLTAKEAKEKNVVEFIAQTREQLFTKLDSLHITKNGVEYEFNTKDLEIVTHEMNIIEQFLYHISNPNIAYILLMLGFYGILAEFSNPGIGFAGVFGSISLLLALFALSNLPINLVGILLIFAGIVLIILEVKVQSSGILGIGGVVAIILGSMMLIRSHAPFLQISVSLIVGVAIFSVLFFALLLTLVLKVHKSKIKTGKEGEIGKTGYVKIALDPEGKVWVRGELWNAKSLSGNIPKGTKIQVLNMDRMTLIVKKNE